jgi:hypothetical protein
MGWTEDTAKELAAMLEKKAISYRALGDKLGHTHQYWWKRLGSRETALTLEDIEALCVLLQQDPKVLLANTRMR